ncbi:hypothetical protein DSECCO2_471800 [anaerobic digester metagenome]
MNEWDFELDRNDCFLVNYLGGRAYQYGIDAPVRDLFEDVERTIEFLIQKEYIENGPSGWILTEKGTMARIYWRSSEKLRESRKNVEISEVCQTDDYLRAYNSRAKYERESVIPHGIFVSFGEEDQSPWGSKEYLPQCIKNYISNSKMLDFSDINNSESFKQELRNYYIADEINGKRSKLPKDFEIRIGECLVCPTLDIQIAEKCTFLNPPKLQIYIDTKIHVLNWTSINATSHKSPYIWDGHFLLGVYDCTNSFHAAMAEYEKMKLFGVEGLPKTFQTFWKHKSQNSEKYQFWNAKFHTAGGR